MSDPSRYPSQVFWSDEDQGFIAIVLDLPGCSAFGTTRKEAAAELEHAIVAWIEAARAAGNPVPAPSVPPAPDRPCVNQAHDDRGYLLAEVERLTRERDTLRKVILDAAYDAEWWDKKIHLADSNECYQNWRLEIYLPVPCNIEDKGIESALDRVIFTKTKKE